LTEQAQIVLIIAIFLLIALWAVSRIKKEGGQ